MKIALISLGCAKNLVDSEVLLGKLKDGGAEFTDDLEEADCVIVNTCGFIEDAKRESIETILDATERAKRVIVMGCLVERYKEILEKEIPEVERFFPAQSWDQIADYLGLKTENGTQRVLTTPKSFAYLKIAEGCNRLCSFCAIPRIRGRHVSKPMEEVIKEAKYLAEAGVKELCVVSQDTSYYGRDLYRTNKLVDLLRELERIEGIEWIRLLYLYPTEVSEDLLFFVRDSEKVVPYFDIPLQHVDDKVLESMRRGYNERFVRDLIEKIYRVIPDAVLRTTFIVGYPEEGREEFEKLLRFVEEGHFWWAGVFTYSREEGTHAYPLGDPISEEEKEERKRLIMEAQTAVTARRNRSLIGRKLKVLVDGYSEEFSFVPVGRSYLHAPEVDGLVYIETEERILTPGEMVEVEINQSTDYDLGGRLTE